VAAVVCGCFGAVAGAADDGLTAVGEVDGRAADVAGTFVVEPEPSAHVVMTTGLAVAFGLPFLVAVLVTAAASVVCPVLGVGVLLLFVLYVGLLHVLYHVAGTLYRRAFALHRYQRYRHRYSSRRQRRGGHLHVSGHRSGRGRRGRSSNGRRARNDFVLRFAAVAALARAVVLCGQTYDDKQIKQIMGRSVNHHA